MPPMVLKRVLAPNIKQASELISMAWPVVVGLSTYTMLLALNTAFLGRISPEAQGVAAVCDVAFMTVCLTLAGIGIGCQVLVARRLGEGKPRESGSVLDNTLLLAVLIGIAFSVIGYFTAELVSNALLSDPALAKMSTDFLKVRYLGLTPFLIFSAFQGFFIGIGKTKHFLIAAAIRVAVNVFFDYSLIFGKFGMPRLELQGAAWAGTIAFFASFVWFLPVILQVYYKKVFSVLQFSNITFETMKRLARLSTPAGTRQLILLGSYLGFFAIIAKMGTIDLAAANVTRATFNIMFMPVLGVGFAVSSLVSRNLGEGRPKNAESTTFSALHITSLLAVLSYILLAVFAQPVARLFTNDPSVIYVTKECFVYGAPFLMFVPLGIVFASVLEGAGMIWFLLVVEGICCAGYLYIVHLFGIQMGGGLIGSYQAELVYWLVFGVVLGIKFFKRDWHLSKV